MANDEAKMSGIRRVLLVIGRVLLVIGDVVAGWAFLIFLVRALFWPVYSGTHVGIDGRHPEFPIPMAQLGGLGLYWIVRRHGVRILSFYALAMSSGEKNTTAGKRPQRLFDVMDVVSWLVITLYVAALAWIAAGLPHEFLLSKKHALAQLIIMPTLILGLALAGGWLVLRSNWFPRILPKVYLDEIARSAEVVRKNEPPSSPRQ